MKAVNRPGGGRDGADEDRRRAAGKAKSGSASRSRTRRSRSRPRTGSSAISGRITIGRSGRTRRPRARPTATSTRPPTPRTSIDLKRQVLETGREVREQAWVTRTGNGCSSTFTSSPMWTIRGGPPVSAARSWT